MHIVTICPLKHYDDDYDDTVNVGGSLSRILLIMLYLNENIMIVNCEQEMCLECQRCRVQHRKRAQTPFHKVPTANHNWLTHSSEDYHSLPICTLKARKTHRLGCLIAFNFVSKPISFVWVSCLFSPPQWL